jgi:hypothetical protein
VAGRGFVGSGRKKSADGLEGCKNGKAKVEKDCRSQESAIQQCIPYRSVKLSSTVDTKIGKELGQTLLEDVYTVP